MGGMGGLVGGGWVREWAGGRANKPRWAEIQSMSPQLDVATNTVGSPPAPCPLQVLYPTLSDYDIRFYVMEILKVSRFLLLAHASNVPTCPILLAACCLTKQLHSWLPPACAAAPFLRRWIFATPRASCTATSSRTTS